jgi:transcriptional regulator CtsR
MGMKSRKKCSRSKLHIIEVQANLNISRTEMTKHFELVPSSMGNIIFTKDEINEVGIKWGVQTEKK